MQVASRQLVAEADLVEHNRELLKRHGIATVCLVGTPGSGKTTLIETTARRLSGRHRLGVIVANPAAQRDASRIARWTAQVQTVAAACLSPQQASDALAALDLDEIDLLLIEQAGQIDGEPCACLGQDATVSVFSVTGGDDKAAEFSPRVAAADALLLTKIDLLPHVEFSLETFRRDIARINHRSPLMELSCTNGRGMGIWIDWLSAWVFEHRMRNEPAVAGGGAEWFFG